MNNKVLLSTLVGTVTAFLIGFLIYGFLLEGFMKNNAGMPEGFMKAEPQMVTMVLANAAFALLLTYIFHRWAGIKSASGGAAAGTIIGFLMISTFDLLMYSTSNMMNLTGLIADILAFTVMSAATGAVIGWFLGRGETVKA